MEEKKCDLEKQRSEDEKSRLEQEKKHIEALAELQEKSAAIDKQISELKERELDLENRENALNAARREFNARRYAASETAYGYSAPYAAPPAGYPNNGYGTSEFRPSEPSPTPNPSFPSEDTASKIDFGDLKQRAKADGIQIKTAGSMGNKNRSADNNFAPTFNKGLTLFKAALIMFCIVIAESLVIFFVREKLGVSGLYPAIGFAAGFAAFLTCTILYACGYRQQARRSKHPSYLLNASILFVIGVIAITMIAVYLKADLKQPTELLTYVILPVLYLLNLVFFAVFYYLFTLSAKNSASQN